MSEILHPYHSPLRNHSISLYAIALTLTLPQGALNCLRARFYWGSIVGDLSPVSRGAKGRGFGEPVPDAFDLLMMGLGKRMARMDENDGAKLFTVDELCAEPMLYAPTKTTYPYRWCAPAHTLPVRISVSIRIRRRPRGKGLGDPYRRFCSGAQRRSLQLRP